MLFILQDEPKVTLMLKSASRRASVLYALDSSREVPSVLNEVLLHNRNPSDVEQSTFTLKDMSTENTNMFSENVLLHENFV